MNSVAVRTIRSHRSKRPTLSSLARRLAVASVLSLAAGSTDAFVSSNAASCRSRSFLSSSASVGSGVMTVDTAFEVAQFPCLDSNYGYLLHDPSTEQTAAIDTPCAESYRTELDKRGWKLTHILNTHHHADHTGGNLALKQQGVTVIGPAGEKNRIPGIDIAVAQGDTVHFGNHKATVIDVGGHTKGHVAFYFDEQNSAFVGDSLFVLGCGRMFEGTPEQFWTSLKRLRDLPDNTKVYCAHEYTESNAKFAMSVEPNNPDLQQQTEKYKAMRAEGKPTVPSLLGDEKKANPFLRCDTSDEIRSNVGVVDGDSDEQVFGKVRRAKDNF